METERAKGKDKDDLGKALNEEGEEGENRNDNRNIAKRC